MLHFGTILPAARHVRWYCSRPRQRLVAASTVSICHLEFQKSGEVRGRSAVLLSEKVAVERRLGPKTTFRAPNPAGCPRTFLRLDALKANKLPLRSLVTDPVDFALAILER